MGKIISDMDTSKFAPTAVLKVAGASITGILGDVRFVKTQYGEKPVYSMKVADATCKFTLGKDEVEPEAGTMVDIFAPTRLNNQLKQVQKGQTVKIDYLGTVKNKGGKGMPAHSFRCEIL